MSPGPEGVGQYALVQSIDGNYLSSIQLCDDEICKKHIERIIPVPQEPGEYALKYINYNKVNPSEDIRFSVER
jgi:hypothetical protein